MSKAVALKTFLVAHTHNYYKPTLTSFQHSLGHHSLVSDLSPTHSNLYSDVDCDEEDILSNIDKGEPCKEDVFWSKIDKGEQHAKE